MEGGGTVNAMDISIWASLLPVFIVLLIMAPAVYFTTRWFGHRQTVGRSVRIRETLPLGTGRAIYVVEWREKEFLLGVTGHSMQLLDSMPILDDPTEEDH